MNKRLIFIVEGETEKEFVENLIIPRFNNEYAFMISRLLSQNALMGAFRNTTT